MSVVAILVFYLISGIAKLCVKRSIANKVELVLIVGLLAWTIV